MDGHSLDAGDRLENPVERIRYRILGRLGGGGFGTAYLASVTGRGAWHMPRRVCIKLTTDIRSWITEAYFGYLLEGQDRALTIFDMFPVPDCAGWYAISSEFAEYGDLARYLHVRGSGLSESRARREVARLLGVLDVLHKGGALHRDLTPFNVFVCAKENLKLGDFGIAKHAVSKKGVLASTMAPWMAPSEIRDGFVHRWAARDDVYQVGQLLSMLLSGDAERAIRPIEIRHLNCSDDTKEIIQRCIGRRGKRFETAGELIARLQAIPRVQRAGKVKSLDGKSVVFTGALKVSRDIASQLAEQAGARVQSKVSRATDIVVKGRSNVQQVAGARGQKLIDVSMWRDRGVDIKVIGERRFMELVS